MCYVPTVLLLGKKDGDTPEKPVQSDESEAEEEITPEEVGHIAIPRV